MRLKNLLYKASLFFKRGVVMHIVPTWACNFDCSYCSNKIPNGIYPKEKEIKPMERWLNFIYTYRPKEVIISGGEPSLYPGIHHLINNLLDLSINVTLYTNLTGLLLLNCIEPSINFKIITTHHKGQIIQYEWLKNYYDIRKKYLILVDALGFKRFDFERLKPWQTAESSRRKFRGHIFVGPDLQVFSNCYDRANAYKQNLKT